ncbi:DUF6584 family protein [Paraflavisolibacter sp. H34]|uniref:DUF6584 family protein n=1 Tax=Huijunlia imazamoxiresistens TaxID=3127457 RepID=UPI00301906D7
MGCHCYNSAMKSLIGIITALFKPQGQKKPLYPSRRRKKGLQERVAEDLSRGDHKMAVRRLMGSLQHDPLDPLVLDKLATILFAYGLDERAGRYWYLKMDKGEGEREAVRAFEKSLGSDPIAILKKLITKRRFAFSRLSEPQLRILEDLLIQSRQREGTTPRFLKGLERHLNSPKRFTRPG